MRRLSLPELQGGERFDKTSAVELEINPLFAGNGDHDYVRTCKQAHFCYDGVRLGPKVVYEQWDQRSSDRFKFEVKGYTNPPSPQNRTSASTTYWPL
jgi:hypothetical protein